MSKSWISLKSALLFALASLYGVTTCPTDQKHLINTALFFVLTYISMMGSDLCPKLKLKYSIYATLLFFFFSSALMYKLTNSLSGVVSLDMFGCPTPVAVAIHAVVYGVALYLMMGLPKDMSVGIFIE